MGGLRILENFTGIEEDLFGLGSVLLSFERRFKLSGAPAQFLQCKSKILT